MAANSAQEAIGLLVHAYYELRNVEATLACVTDDIMWVGTETGDTACGKTALRRLLRADAIAYPAPFGIELDAPRIQPLGNAAASVWLTGRQLEAPGSAAGLALRATLACVKTADGWLVSSIHVSIPGNAKAMLQEQQNLHQLIDDVPTGIGIYEIDHGEVRQSYMNNAFYAMLGQDREARSLYGGADTLKAVHPDDVAAIQTAVTGLLTGQNHANVTYRLRLDSDNWFWVHLAASVVERRENHLKIYAAVSDYSEIMQTRRELETSRNTLRTALDAAQVFSWRYDYKQGRITDSGTLGEAFGLPKVVEDVPRAIIAMGFVAPESEANFYRLYRDASAEKTAAADIQSNVGGEHGRRWFRQIYTPVFDENGRYTDAIGIAIDISEQKHREQLYEDQLRLNKVVTQDALSRVCMNLTRNTITAFDSASGDYDQNAAYHTAADLLGSVSRNLDSETERQKFASVSSLEKMIGLYRNGTRHIDIVFHFNEGARWQCATYDMMENPYTGDLEVISAIHDVTERERTKLVINQLIALHYESIALIDLTTGKLIPMKKDSADKNMQEVIGLQAKLNSGEGGLKTFLEKYALPGTAQKVIAENSIATITARLARAPSYECSYCLLRGGRQRHYRVVYSRVESDSTVLLCAVQDITDITEHEELQKRELAAALAQAQAASRAKTAFLSRVSHDMRTPLNGILGLTTLMKDVAISPKVLQDLNQLELSGHYLLGLINDTLDVNRIESGQMELHPAVCDSRSVLNNVIRLMQPSMDAKHIRFTVSADSLPMSPIFIDEGRLQQVAMNILGNAAKFTPEGGHVDMRAQNLSIENGIIRDEFLITDNGIGMSEEYLPHIFESFSQEDDTTTNIHKGTGLGMTITYQIVKLMGGHIEVKSRKGEGTCVRVVLDFPIATEEQIANCQKSKQPHAASYNLAGKRVLLCEDHPLNTQIAVRLLKKVDVQVDHAANGVLGVELFEQSAPGQYDAILMDIRMPVMDGLDATRRIRALDRPDAKTIPILAMTANALAEDVQHSHEAGMDAHLSKPIDPQSLYRTLEQFVNPQNTFSKPRILVVDDREINRAVIVAALLERYEVFEADSGEAALALLAAHHGMDVVVTDIQMPEMDGTELIGRIRGEEAFRHTVIIAYTQYEQSGQEEYLLSLGANDFLYKPANPKIVEIRIENALHRL